MKYPKNILVVAMSLLLLAACGANAQEGSASKKAEPVDSATATAPIDTITIAMSGDLMFGTDWPTTQLAANDGKHLLQHTAPITSAATLAVGNLEGVFCSDDVPPNNPDTHFYSFRFPARYAPRLTEAGYDFMCIANNHTYDFREEGQRQTEAVLDEHGIAYSGIKGHPEYAIIERSGIKFGVCAFGHNWYSVQHIDLANVERVLKALRPKCDILVVTFHGGAEGTEYRHLPQGEEFYLNASRGSLRKMAHYCVDLGADVVFGHGPHVVRCMELYKDRLIAYSLGNFCTPYSMGLAGIKGYAPLLVERVGRDGRFIDAQIHSFIQQKGTGPLPDPQNLAAKEIRSLTESDIENNQLTITDDGKVFSK